MNVFNDQHAFMRACDQSVDKFNGDQFAMYVKLIDEEVAELTAAREADDDTEVLDALIDIIVVSIGALHSLGVDSEGAWKEVMSTNFAKIDKDTGKVRRREDGKVLKPMGWQAPQLSQFFNKK